MRELLGADLGVPRVTLRRRAHAADRVPRRRARRTIAAARCAVTCASCEACRKVAADEAALRDGLRALPPLDPPRRCGPACRRQLAAAEVADAETPAWRRARRALARWLADTPRFGLAGAALAVAARRLCGGRSAKSTDGRRADADRAFTITGQHRAGHAARTASTDDARDVTAELAAAPARDDRELRRRRRRAGRSSRSEARVAVDRRSQAGVRRQARDAAPRRSISAAEGRPRQQAYRSLIRYLQSAADPRRGRDHDGAFAMHARCAVIGSPSLLGVRRRGTRLADPKPSAAKGVDERRALEVAPAGARVQAARDRQPARRRPRRGLRRHRDPDRDAQARARRGHARSPARVARPESRRHRADHDHRRRRAARSGRCRARPCASI